MLVTSSSVESMIDNCSTTTNSGASATMKSTGSMEHPSILQKHWQGERSFQVSPSDIMSLPIFPYEEEEDSIASVGCTSTDFMPNNQERNIEKPFFIMDWLEHVDPTAIELAQKMLRRPTAVRNRALPLLSSSSLLKKDASLPPSTSASMNSSSNSLTKTPASHYFLQRSIAIGNGYNAKGIQKARLGLWDEALSCWNSALDIRTQIFTESHVDVANTCNNIGIALGKLNRCAEAMELLHRALDIRIRHYDGETHPQVAATLHNIGNVHQQTGDYEAAIRYFCQCKILQETIYGCSDHVEVARACVAIGHTYFQADALVDAREAYMDALSIFHRVGLSNADSEVHATIHDIEDLDAKLRKLSKSRY